MSRAVVHAPLRKFEKQSGLRPNVEDTSHLLAFVAAGTALQNDEKVSSPVSRARQARSVPAVGRSKCSCT